ncbi:MAG TPA: anti-sigma factor [Burkholderiales bacterium]|nr:anti-sigma factor [Burkholderiales bacterium]
MDCTQAQEQLDRLQDGELEALTRRKLRAHIANCTVCAAADEQLSALRSAVRDNASYFTAPETLRQRVVKDLRAKRASMLTRAVQMPWWGFAASMTGATALAVALTLALTLPSTQDQLGQDVVASHVRSLMGNHLADIASSDQHTVKPWFNGKLDFSPPVHDLAAEGFPLLAGRLDYVGGRPVAALVYQRRQHRINVFVWPAAREQAVGRSVTINGYNAVEWMHAGMVFWAVSDVNSRDLSQLKDLLQAQAG